MNEAALRLMDSVAASSFDFIVVDFETVTPKGSPPKPIEVAADSCDPRSTRAGLPFSEFMRPNGGAVITHFDFDQTGIRQSDVDSADPAEFVLGRLEALLDVDNLVLVAQNASYEFRLFRQYSDACPKLAGAVFVDTVALAKVALPDLERFNLDSIARRIGATVPSDRHRALPDVVLTKSVLRGLISSLEEAGVARSVGDLIRLAGLKDSLPHPKQQSLF